MIGFTLSLSITICLFIIWIVFKVLYLICKWIYELPYRDIEAKYESDMNRLEYEYRKKFTDSSYWNKYEKILGEYSRERKKINKRLGRSIYF